MLCIIVVSEEFVASDYGSDCVAIGAQYITNTETCERAASALQKTVEIEWDGFLYKLNTPDLQKGCIERKRQHNLYPPRVYFNTALHHMSKDFNVKSLCKKGKKN